MEGPTIILDLRKGQVQGHRHFQALTSNKGHFQALISNKEVRAHILPLKTTRR